MTTEIKKIGELLVENGTISQKTLQRALDKSKAENKKVGAILEEMGVATEEEIAQALADQFGCQIVRNIADYSFSAELLKIIAADVAVRYLLFPLKMDGNKLRLAMADPTDTRIAENVAKNHGLTIVPYIATRGDIIAAINKHYLGKDARPDKRKTVLVVEDNSLISFELETLLSQEGYRVLSAKDGIQAFKKAITEAPDVIVTDKEMPGFDGYRLLESLKSIPETRRIPVLLLTASLNDEEEAEAFKKGFFDFMAKPVNKTTLVTRIKRAIQVFSHV